MNEITIVALSITTFLILCYFIAWMINHSIRWKRGLPSLFNDTFHGHGLCEEKNTSE